jgi:uncharacterized protein (TIGR03000 family)
MPKQKVSEAAPATIHVSLPADSTLKVDEVPTRSNSATRVLVTPALAPGEDYYYTLKAEAVRDGKTVTATKRVRVRPGEETRVTLDNFVGEGVASR